MVRDLAGLEKVFVVPTGGGVELSKYLPKKEKRRKPYDILYLGTMEWFPNAQGLIWFMDEVLPVIVRKIPDVRLNIVGFGNPDGELVKKAESNPNVKFWGQQEDDIKFFHGAKVFIVPLWIGAGARVKIPTAWASMAPVVSTSLGAEGLRAENMENIILADDPAEFAAGVIRLLRDEEFTSYLTENALKTVQEHYTIEQCVKTLQKGYKEMLAFPGENRNISQ
jgi:glycosyltransferase involved in cell wall biosynthesis